MSPVHEGLVMFTFIATVSNVENGQELAGIVFGEVRYIGSSCEVVS